MKHKVTVLMPVYNGEKYLKEAIDSILSQTFRDFEFLIINDGSTDKSAEIIASYPDPRIRLVHNGKNIKLIATLNKGLDLARGEYIARMDCDDISLPDRLAKQVAFMDENPDIGICGTWVKTIGEVEGDVWRYPSDHDTIKCMLLFGSVLAHPSVMMRREMLRNHNLKYDSNYTHAEDFQLWRRASQLFLTANIGEILVLYRITSNSVSRYNREAQLKTLRQIDSEAIGYLGLSPSSSELDFHRRLGSYDFESTKEFVGATKNWLLKLHDANEKITLYPTSAFDRVLGERWYAVCNAATALGLWTWKFFWQSSLSSHANLGLKQRIVFALRCVVGRKG